MRRRVAAAVVVIMASVWTLAGCHTVKGVGQDMEKGGQAVERSSGK